MAYKIECYLGQVPDADIELAVGDAAGLEITAYDADGNDWDSGYSATLVVRRCLESSTDQIEVDELVETTPEGDNVYYFSLASITYESGDYDAFLVLEGEWDAAFDEALETTYSFEPFTITVRD